MLSEGCLFDSRGLHVENALWQDIEPQIAPDVLVGTLHGSHSRQCMYVCMHYCQWLWTEASDKCHKCKSISKLWGGLITRKSLQSLTICVQILLRRFPEQRCWISVADPAVWPLTATVIMKANKEMFLQGSIKNGIRTYGGVITDALMYMTYNELPALPCAQMYVEISWLCPLVTPRKKKKKKKQDMKWTNTWTCLTLLIYIISTVFYPQDIKKKKTLMYKLCFKWRIIHLYPAPTAHRITIDSI